MGKKTWRSFKSGLGRTYVSMYLSEQIPESEWALILNENPEVKKAWRTYLEGRNEKANNMP